VAEEDVAFSAARASEPGGTVTEIRIDFDFGHPPALVWRALTDRRQLSRWFMPGDLEPIRGSKFQLLPDALPGFDGPVAGQVLEVEAGRRLVMRWKGEQLHARVSWELRAKPQGCLLMVSQSGFLGVRGSARRQALVSTYDRLFGERLPAVLDGLAGKGDAVLPRPPRLPEPVPPRSHHRRRQLLAIVAAALLIGLVATLLANLPAETGAPAEALATTSSDQPAALSSAVSVSAPAIDATPGPPSASPSSSVSSATTRPPTTPRVTRNATSEATAAAPAALAARYRTVEARPLGGYRGEVVVSNTGGSRSGGWTVTITVPLLALVTGVEGPPPRLNGTAWTFSGAALPPGGSARVVFDVALDILDGQQRPLSCDVGGTACAGL
jgi:uncharacterized protein YndB with AHSA1/START domain